MVKFVSFSGILLFNMGLMAGLIIGALLLLRPLLTRLLTPGQRVALWMVAWLPIYMPQTYEGSNLLPFLPAPFRPLGVPWGGISNNPTFFQRQSGRAGTITWPCPAELWFGLGSTSGPWPFCLWW